MLPAGSVHSSTTSEVLFMAVYLLSYDLRKQRDYEKLTEALEAVSAVRVLESVWAFSYADTNCKLVRDHFVKFIDDDDGLFVVEEKDWAGRKLLNSPPNS